MKWLIVFDLDRTLAQSKRPLSAEMAATHSAGATLGEAVVGYQLLQRSVSLHRPG